MNKFEQMPENPNEVEKLEEAHLTDEQRISSELREQSIPLVESQIEQIQSLSLEEVEEAIEYTKKELAEHKERLEGIEEKFYPGADATIGERGRALVNRLLSITEAAPVHQKTSAENFKDRAATVLEALEKRRRELVPEK